MIYFDENKKAYSYNIENAITQIEDAVWKDFALSAPGSTWDIIDGEFADLRESPEYKAQVLTEAKAAKYAEANTGAKSYLESGGALFELSPGRNIEATDGNIGKLGAYALSFVTGMLEATEVVYWNTKEDETIALTQEELSTVLMGLGQVQAQVWNVKFPAYLARINAAETVEEVEGIEIDYSAALLESDASGDEQAQAD